MPKITRTDNVSLGDLAVVYANNSGDFRGTPYSSVVDLMQNALTFPDAGKSYEVTQYAAPAAAGFNIVISGDSGQSVHLIITPSAGLAGGAITLPDVGTLKDRQEIVVNCTNQITSLTIDGSGAASVVGAPSSLGADDFFRLKFDAITGNWYRIG